MIPLPSDENDTSVNISTSDKNDTSDNISPTPSDENDTTPSDNIVTQQTVLSNMINKPDKGPAPAENLEKINNKNLPRLSNHPIIAKLQQYLGFPEKTGIDPVPAPAKEAKAIDRMRSRGFTDDEIFECWRIKVDERGCYVSMVYVNEDIGTNGHQPGANKSVGRGTRLPTKYTEPPYDPRLDAFRRDTATKC